MAKHEEAIESKMRPEKIRVLAKRETYKALAEFADAALAYKDKIADAVSAADLDQYDVFEEHLALLGMSRPAYTEEPEYPEDDPEEEES